MELTLNQKLSLIQKEFKANKSKFNSFGKYNFRSAEDILEALKPFNEKYGVSFIISEELIEVINQQINSLDSKTSIYNKEGELEKEIELFNKTIPIMKSTATIFDNNGINEISATAVVGVDLNQKGMQVPQQFGSASSYAKKYALGNLLLIDDTQDADATNKGDNKWLNKNTPEFKKAVQYIKDGGSISAIEAKYKMTKEVKEELSKFIK